MFYNLRRSLSYWKLNLSLHQIATTPEIRTDSDGSYIAVTQVCARDVYMYLLATKSLFRFYRPKEIYFLNDGSLTQEHLQLINTHLPDAKQVHISEMNTAPCPQAGTWERLALVVDLAKRSYVIQLDCDTLTLKPPTILMEFVQNKISFAQGTMMGREILPMTEFCNSLPQSIATGRHVQVVAEINFPKLKNFKTLRYLRGCSGFSGFAPGAADRSDMAEFSTEIESIIGKSKWSEWGSEQVMSNVLVANSPRAEVLPMPDYAYFHPNTDLARSHFLHFMGPARFHKGVYAKLGKTVIRELSSTP